MRTIPLVLAAVCIVCIVWFTMAAQTRPHIFPSPALDRVAAFAAAGLLLSLAFPRHILPVLVVLILGAIGTEALQFLRPTRDPRLIDGVAKVIGSLAGVGIVALGKASYAYAHRPND